MDVSLGDRKRQSKGLEGHDRREGLASRPILDNLTSMTKKTDTRAAKMGAEAHWQLQDAKARFSELVRLAQREGPQHISVHGRAAVVLISAETFHASREGRTGRDLTEAMQAIPFRDLDFERPSVTAPIRDVDL